MPTRAASSRSTSTSPPARRTTHFVRFVLGDGAEHATALARAARLTAAGAPDAERARAQAHWDDLLGRAHVETPDPAMNLLLNRWLLVPDPRVPDRGPDGALPVERRVRIPGPAAGRARAAACEPDVARGAHRWRRRGTSSRRGTCCTGGTRRSGRGVRTRCSDDLLWLPYATATLRHATGDVGVLDEEVPYLAGAAARPREHERYAQWSASERRASLYRALPRRDRAREHVGPARPAADPDAATGTTAWIASARGGRGRACGSAGSSPA